MEKIELFLPIGVFKVDKERAQGTTIVQAGGGREVRYLVSGHFRAGFCWFAAAHARKAARTAWSPSRLFGHRFPGIIAFLGVQPAIFIQVIVL